MNNELRLLEEIERVGRRYRRLVLWAGLSLCWAVLALTAGVLLVWTRGNAYTVPGVALILLVVLPLGALLLLMSAWRRMKSPLWVAHRIERRFPELDTRLLAALEQAPKRGGEPLGFLQESVVLEVLDHERRTGWDRIIPPAQLKFARWTHAVLLLLFVGVMWTLIGDMRARQSESSNWWLGGLAQADDSFEIAIEPQDTSVERGTSLLVLARFKGKLPDQVELIFREEASGAGASASDSNQLPMSKSLDDPLFAARVPAVERDMTYAVRYADATTKWYKVSVFDYPELQRADAKLTFPAYTKLPEAAVEDTRSVTAVEGTKARFTFRLNKPVNEAALVPVATSATQPAAAPVTLTVDPEEPNLYRVAFDFRESQKYRLKLVDKDGREAKQPAELAVNVTPNRPPDLKLEFPGRDVDVSPLEELTTRAQVWDDFGVQRVGLSYAMGGQPPRDMVLAQDVSGKERRAVSHMMALEALSAKPDDLLSYFFWVEDVGPDGNVRRTSGDMFFAEVRPFEEIFREGEQPAGGEEQQQQQQQGQGQNAQQAEQLAELQKQIIAATWKVMRREISATLTQQFVPDVKLMSESQSRAKAQGSALGQQLQDPRSQAHLKNVLRHMDDAIKHLDSASSKPSAGPLSSALASEQSAYQELLKLRAREHEVVRGNRRQQQGASQSSASARRQRQLDQLELANQENRYETQRTAPQQQEDPAQREQRQVLNRLRELAQRQEDLNRQMREIQSALEQARDEQQREELRRQLARLRDQQQQMLRDTDELRDRMDRPENQERMADSRQQLEQTRSDVRRASEALEQGMVPQASSAGARAAEQFNDMRERVRQQATDQFEQAMQEMRQQARQLDQRQQELSQRMTELDGERTSATQPAPQRGLRDSGERAEAVTDLAQQKERLQQLLEQMKRTVEEAELPQPLLSRQLYDASREAAQGRADQALESARQLLDRGFVGEARQAEAEANRGVTRLREGVERAAEGVLGNEAEALRLARDQLDALAQELDRERGGEGEAGVASAAASRPTTDQSRLARGGSGARQERGQRDDGDATTQLAGGTARDGRERQEQQDSRRQQDRQGLGEQRDPQGRQGSGQQQARGDGAQPGEGQQGSQREGEQPGEGEQRAQPGEGESSAQSGGGEERAQSGEGEQGAQPGEGEQRAQSGQGMRSGQSGEGEQQSADASEGRGGRRGDQREREPAGDGDRDGQARGDGRNSRDARGDLRRFLDGGAGNGGGGAEQQARGPLTGGNFREWSDRLRDVEEMVGEPDLRAEAARIRDAARAIRAEFERHSKEPAWDVVQDRVAQPLVELRQKVSEELLRRESSEALVPIDRDPVPSNFAEQVRRYYERLGSGR